MAFGYQEEAAAPTKKSGAEILAQCAQAINEGLATGAFTDDEAMIAEQATTLLQKGKMAKQDLQDKALGAGAAQKFMRQG